MRLGIISIQEDGTLKTVSGTVSRRGFVRDAEELLRDVSGLEFIYLTARSARTVIHDVELPAPLTGRALVKALAFELERLLPVRLEEVSWGYWKLGRENRSFRIFAILRRELKSMLEILERSRLRCDAFVPAQIFTGPDPAERPRPPEAALLEYLSRDPSGKNLITDGAAVPKNLRPVRYRWLQMACRAVLLLAAMLFLLVLWDRFLDFRERIAALDAEKNRLEAELRVAESAGEQFAVAMQLQQNIIDTRFGSAMIAPILADLSRRLPDDMWVAGHTQNGDQIDVTIITSRDEVNLPRLLESGLYSFVNISKTVNPADQSVVQSVKLRSCLP